MIGNKQLHLLLYDDQLFLTVIVLSCLCTNCLTLRSEVSCHQPSCILR